MKKYNKNIMIKEKTKTTIPENSCKKPLATQPPKKCARMPVIVNRKTLQRKATGIADKTIINLFKMDPLIRQANKKPSTIQDISDLIPLHASATSNEVFAK